MQRGNKKRSGPTPGKTHLAGVDDFVAFDPSVRALGWAHWARRGLQASGCLPLGWSEPDIFALCARLHRHGVRCAVVEMQFVGVNPSSAIKTIEARMRVEVLARLHGWSVMRVPATTWQSKTVHVKGERFPSRSKSKRLTTHVPPREILKERSLNAAKAVCTRFCLPHPSSDDEADAINIGAFVLEASSTGEQS